VKTRHQRLLSNGPTCAATLWSRAEDAGKKGSEHREAYDVVTARAVAELRVLAAGAYNNRPMY
jgi:16S rRNA G527 N7-methylase RsmG